MAQLHRGRLLSRAWCCVAALPGGAAASSCRFRAGGFFCPLLSDGCDEFPRQLSFRDDRTAAAFAPVRAVFIPVRAQSKKGQTRLLFVPAGSSSAAVLVGPSTLSVRSARAKSRARLRAGALGSGTRVAAARRSRAAAEAFAVAGRQSCSAGSLVGALRATLRELVPRSKLARWRQALLAGVSATATVEKISS